MRPAVMRHALALLLAGTAAAAAQTAPSSTAAPPAAPAVEPAPGKVTVELNKLEAAGTACRGYFMVTNRSPQALKELRTEVYLFDRKGVVLRRVGLTFADIRPERAKVAIFDLAEVACGDLGRLLINDVLSCTAGDGAPVKACGEMIAATSRAGVEFAY
jgi:hypothetical protein